MKFGPVNVGRLAERLLPPVVIEASSGVIETGRAVIEASSVALEAFGGAMRERIRRALPPGRVNPHLQSGPFEGTVIVHDNRMLPGTVTDIESDNAMTGAALATITGQASPERLADTLAEAAKLAENAVAPNTRRAYQSDRAQWEAWCAAEGIDAAELDPVAIGLWIAEGGRQGLAVSTLRRRAAALAALSRVLHPDRPSPRAHPAVASMLKGATTTYGPTQARERAAGKRRSAARPLTRAELESIADGCDTSRSGLRDRALLLLGWTTGMRRAELAAIEVGDLEHRPEGLAIHIRKAKGNDAGRRVDVHRTGGPYCPVRALAEWIDTAELEDGPVFRPLIGKAERLGENALTGQGVGRILHRRAEAVGVDPAGLSAHSMRRGMITHAVTQGVPEHLVMQQSGHRSVQVFRGYVAEAEFNPIGEALWR